MGNRKICCCNFKIWVEFKWNGLSSVPYYLPADEEQCDELELDVKPGEYLTHCPVCGDYLVYKNLKDREY